jgi:hypothetical protein
MTCRHPLVRLGGVGGLLFVIALGCSGGPTVKGDEPIQMQISTFSVKVENRCGTPISDITVEIVPYGATTTYSVRHYGMRNLEKRDFFLNDFRARDGMALDLSVARVKLVRLSATDLNGKPIKVEIPWKRPGS